jgi:hypothetical protein
MKLKSIITTIVRGTRNELIGWIELFVISGLTALAWQYQTTIVYDNPTDYFFWPALGPVLMSLRYGFGRGLISLLLTLAIIQAFSTLSGEVANMSISVILGTALLTMVTGEFRDSWHLVNQRLTLNQEFANNRLEMFTQSYHLLKVSHDQLEQRLAGQQMSLRTSVQEIRQFTSSDGKLTAEVAERTLAVLDNVISIYQAGFYEYTADGISPVPLAQLGTARELNVDDPMVRDACEQKITVGAKDISEAGDQTNPKGVSKLDYQLVIPLVDVKGNIKGIIVAAQVRFIQLTQSNIALVHLLASVLANLVSTDVHTPKLRPEQRKLFLQYLSNQNNYYNHFRLDSSLVVFTDLSQHQIVDIEDITDFRRGADIYWMAKDKSNRHTVFVLMPITNLLEAERYVTRIRTILLEKPGITESDFEVIGPLYVNKQAEEVHDLLIRFGGFSEDLADSDYADH